MDMKSKNSDVAMSGVGMKTIPRERTRLYALFYLMRTLFLNCKRQVL